MSSDAQNLMETFVSWLQHRVVQTVEAGEVPADLLTELQAEIKMARERPQEEGHAAAIQHIVDVSRVPEEEAAKTLASIEA